jgi:NADH:ubiquinone oxidoreductase subunit D
MADHLLYSLDMDFMTRGQMLADATAIPGTMNIAFGEVAR